MIEREFPGVGRVYFEVSSFTLPASEGMGAFGGSHPARTRGKLAIQFRGAQAITLVFPSPEAAASFAERVGLENLRGIAESACDNAEAVAAQLHEVRERFPTRQREPEHPPVDAPDPIADWVFGDEEIMSLATRGLDPPKSPSL